MIDLETAIRQRDEARALLSALRQKHAFLIHAVNDAAMIANEFHESDPTSCGVVSSDIKKVIK